MARKVERVFEAEIRLNAEKGGAWLTKVVVKNEEGLVINEAISAWKNASASKRWVKEKVKEMTPRKSVPMIGSNLNDKNKPTVLIGTLRYKVDA
jgi:hypothetical protein